MCRRRTLLVTGSSRGIGQAIRDTLLSDGHEVIGLCRNPQWRHAPGAYHAVPCDLREGEAVAKIVHSLFKDFPGLDGVISNAGIPAFGNLEQWSIAEIAASLHMNLTSHLVLARSVLPYLKRHPQSDLIFMGSEAALRGAKQGSIYCSAKFGLRGFAQSLRQECAPAGLRVSILHPGPVRTPFFDHQNFEPGPKANNALDPQDVAAAVKLILSAPASAVFDEISVTPLKRVFRRRSTEDG